MTAPVKAPRELCRVKKAVKELIRQNHEGMTHSEICEELQRRSIFIGTYRNLLTLTLSALGLLVEEGRIRCRGEGATKIFLNVGCVL
jgi:hypothetical protein